MLATPMNGLSALNASLHYGQNINPVKPVKKVNFADMMVVPVKDEEPQENNPLVVSPKQVQGAKERAMAVESSFQQVAKGLQGSSHFYDASMQAGAYNAVGSTFDAIA